METVKSQVFNIDRKEKRSKLGRVGVVPGETALNDIALSMGAGYFKNVRVE